MSTSRTCMTRHSALLLLALDDLWLQAKGKHHLTGGFNPDLHFKPEGLLTTLRDAIRPIIRKVLSEEDVLAHLQFLSQLNDELILDSCTGEEYLFQMGRAGKELADIVNALNLRQYIENDAKHWQAVWLYARLFFSGKCGPDVWTLSHIETLTGLNRGQIHKAARMEGVTFKGEGDKSLVLPAGTFVRSGPRGKYQYALSAVCDDKEDTVDPEKGIPSEELTESEDAVEPGKSMAPEEAVESEEVVDSKGGPVNAHVNLSMAEVNILQAEALRLGMSLGSLVTVLLQKATADIQAASFDRRKVELAELEREFLEAQQAAEKARSQLDSARLKYQKI